MPRPRFDRLPPARQREVLEVAARAFARHGYEGASFNRIMAGLGVSKGSTYYWFTDKADLYSTVLADSVERMTAAMGSIEPAPSRAAFWRQLRQRFEDIGRFYQEDPAAAVLAASVARGEGTPELVERGRKWIEALVEEGQRAGAMRSDLPTDLAAELIWSLTEAADRWLIRHRAELTGEDPELAVGIAATLADIVQRAFRPVAARSAPPAPVHTAPKEDP